MGMSSNDHQPKQQKPSLSRERVVAAAIAILDGEGENALTFRALAKSLSTGSGAIYWHVADKRTLLAAATEHVLSEAIAQSGRGTHPADAVRDVALGVFDVIEAHPWVGTELAREPWQPAMTTLFEKISAGFDAMGVPRSALFYCGSALVQYLLGFAAQAAAAARHDFQSQDRTEVLTTLVARWTQGEPADYPYVHLLADELRSHDEREAFLAGLDLILAGARNLQG